MKDIFGEDYEEDDDEDKEEEEADVNADKKLLEEIFGEVEVEEVSPKALGKMTIEDSERSLSNKKVPLSCLDESSLQLKLAATKKRLRDSYEQAAASKKHHAVVVLNHPPKLAATKKQLRYPCEQAAASKKRHTVVFLNHPPKFRRLVC